MDEERRRSEKGEGAYDAPFFGAKGRLSVVCGHRRILTGIGIRGKVLSNNSSFHGNTALVAVSPSAAVWSIPHRAGTETLL